MFQGPGGMIRSHVVSSLLTAHGTEKFWIPSGLVQGIREAGGFNTLLASSLVMFFPCQPADLMCSETWVDNGDKPSSIPGAGIQGSFKVDS